MRALVRVVAFGYLATLVLIVPAAETAGRHSGSRNDIRELTLSDGSVLKMGIEYYPEKERKEMGVDVALYSKKNTLIWRTWDITVVAYTPEAALFYAFAKIQEDNIYLFTTWNGNYCVIDRKTGKIVRKGEGDQLLNEWDSFAPLKLTFGLNLRGHLGRAPASKLVDDTRQILRDHLARSTLLRFQDIPGAELRKTYVVQFDTDSKGRLAGGRHPRFVIVWKAESSRVSFNFQGKVPVTSVNGHWMTPSPTKRAIYALQPDYSLRQLPFSEEELSRLFSHITQRELRIDEIVASRLSKEGTEIGGGRVDNEESFEADRYWEQKVDPHLEVVEPVVAR